MFHLGLYREKHEIIFLSETIRYSLDIWYVASQSGPLPSLFKLDPGVKNGPGPGLHVLHRLIYGKNMKKSSCLKS